MSGFSKEIIAKHDEVYEVLVVAGENAGLYDPITPVSEKADCPRFEVDLTLGEIDCDSDEPTVTVVFKNNSDVAVSFDYHTEQTLSLIHI